MIRTVAAAALVALALTGAAAAEPTTPHAKIVQATTLLSGIADAGTRTQVDGLILDARSALQDHNVHAATVALDQALSLARDGVALNRAKNQVSSN